MAAGSAPAQGAPASGILLVDKPQGITSHGAVSRARRAFSTRKVGHAGTLDPMATGLLVLGLGSSTRLLTFLVGVDKEYLATVRLGQATTTDDAEGEPLGSRADARRLPDSDVLREMAVLTGPILQVPSSVSAIKVDGKRAYARVRSGEEVDLAARPVTVAAFELLGRDEPTDVPGALDLRVRVECSSGTYVRALARDLGAALGVGAHLTALRRTRVGPFGVDGAAPADELSADTPVLPAAEVARRLFPVLDLTAEQAVAVRHGRRIPVDAADSERVAAVGPAGELLALVAVERGTARVLAGFPSDSAAEAS